MIQKLSEKGSDPSKTLRQPKFSLTLEGGAWLVGTLALLATGLGKGINLIALLASLMLSLAAFNWIMARRQLRGLRGRRLVLEPVFAQTPFTFLVELRHTGRRKRVGLKIVDHLAGQQASWFVSRIKGKESLKFDQKLTVPRRGRYSWGPLLASSGYPLGLIRRSRTLAAAQEMVVLPSLGQLQRGVLRRFLMQSSPTLGQSVGRPCYHRTAQTEFHGLRPFQDGDTPRWIHWRTSARRGELMVREFEELPSDNLILIVEPWLPEPLPNDHDSSNAGKPGSPTSPGPADILEIALSLSATICWEWCRQKGDHLVLAIAGKDPFVLSGVTSRDLALEMLEALAVQEGCRETDAALLLDRLHQSDLRAGPILLITTHPGDFEEILAAALHHPLACVNVADGGYHDFFTPHPSLLVTAESADEKVSP